MAIRIGSARIDERGKISGGKNGDQTGKEVAEEKFYVHVSGWYILRAKEKDHALKLAERMKTACENSHIGYSQSNRLGIIKNGINSNTDTAADCSSLVRECVIEATGKDPGNFTTANEKNKLLSTGLFQDIGAYTKEKTLNTGDILVTCKKGHTAIVTSGESPKAGIIATDSYPKYTGSSSILNIILKTIGAPYGDVAARKPLATANGISNYRGTYEQNITLIRLAKSGNLRRV